MFTAQQLHQEIIDYGVSEWTVHSAQGACAPAPAKINSAAHYVWACRRYAHRHGLDLPEDGRVIAVGWNRWSPTQWVTEELAPWAVYWTAANARPGTVYSPYNSDLYACYRAYRRGIPASWLKGAPLRDIRAAGHRRSRLRHAARALRRTSAKCQVVDRVDHHTLSMLGRLSPELQRAAITRLERDYGDSYHPLRAKHVDWAFVASVQDQIRRDPHVRARWATGKRQLQLLDLPDGDLDRLCEKFGVKYFGDYHTIMRLARGERPEDLAQGLTPTEAHQWLVDTHGWATPAEWLLSAADIPTTWVRDVDVARWAVAAYADPARREQLASKRTRSVRYLAWDGYRTETADYTYIDNMMHQVAPHHLDNGEDSDVEQVFALVSAEYYVIEELSLIGTRQVVVLR